MSRGSASPRRDAANCASAKVGAAAAPAFAIGVGMLTRSPLGLDTLADTETLRARGRAPHRLAAGAPRHHDDEIARLIDDGDHRILIVLIDPDREHRTLGLAAVLDHAPRLAGHLEDRLL